ncbi:hypothetical protein SBADM41S_00343 [Streptomyces badius]
MAHVDGEGLPLAVGVHDTVPAQAGDAGHGGVVADLVAQDVGEGLEVLLGPVGPGGVGRTVGGGPAGGREELRGGRID